MRFVAFPRPLLCAWGVYLAAGVALAVSNQLGLVPKSSPLVATLALAAGLVFGNAAIHATRQIAADRAEDAVKITGSLVVFVSVGAVILCLLRGELSVLMVGLGSMVGVMMMIDQMRREALK